MKVGEVREKYLQFMQKNGHAIIPSASLVPLNDSTTLFTGSGMQPLLPYLLGEPHPMGRRLSDSQKCFRAEDIDEIGDNRHTTFFEMLGNWSFGSYWKEEQLLWFYEFLTKEVKIPSEKLWVTCFEGDEKLNLPKDEESARIWEKIGIPSSRIKFYSAKKNWWSRSGVPENMPEGEPGGADSEVFYDFGTELGLHEKSEWKNELCHPNCDCGRFLEIGNSVFMEYRKTADGSFEKLEQRNVDFGGGLERISAVSNDEADIFLIDRFASMLEEIETNSGKKYTDISVTRSFRIVMDHIRASVFLISDGVLPANKDQGYFARRLLRRAVFQYQKIAGGSASVVPLVDRCIAEYGSTHKEISKFADKIVSEITAEETRFLAGIQNVLSEFERMSQKGSVSAEEAFLLFTSHGFPLEMTVDLAAEKGIEVDVVGFQKLFEEHKSISRVGSEMKFKGGLADSSEKTLQYHTTTHILNEALRRVLGDHVEQMGSNITGERLRFDFSHDSKMTDDEKNKVEELVNSVIRDGVKVQNITMKKDEAIQTGARHMFNEKYGEEVSVYFIGESLDSAFSKEFCGGPHVGNTGDIKGTFKIIKEESVAKGVRRIKAVVV